ncbi:hypothetical protein AB1Y20_007716 [Prymnesium parvum]|uniref:Uncharacterized protein n=1 Tax=Prymnesium parvum TaxID=97485 RepID=A0AB34IYT7_PRYPA
MDEAAIPEKEEAKEMMATKAAAWVWEALGRHRAADHWADLVTEAVHSGMVARPAGGVGAVVARAAVRKVMEAAEEGSGECWDWAEGLVVSMVAGSSVAKVAAVAVAVR